MKRYKPTTLIGKKLQRRRLGEIIANAIKPKKEVANPLKSDPTRSATIRRLFLAQIKRKFKALKRQLNALVVEEDAFGLREEEFNPFRLDSTLNVFCPTGEGGGVDPTCSPVEMVTVYHGTSSSAIESIKQNGLVFGKGSGADVYVKQLDGVDYAVTYAHIEGRRVSVFVSTDAAQASTYAFRAAKLNKAEPVVLKVEVTKASLIEDEAGGSINSFRVEGAIHPTSIREVFKIDYDKDELVSVGALTDNAGLVKVYVCFLARKEVVTNYITTNAGRWRYESDPRKVELFRLWLMRQMEEQVLGSEQVTTDDWWDAYIEQAYSKGESRSYDDVKKPGKLGGDKQKLDFYTGTKKEFLESSFNRPVHRDKVKILAGRVFTDLKGVTEGMSQAITRTLTDGLIQGLNPRDIAKQMDDAVDIGINRANVIARTEITRAHAEGQLDAMIRLGVKEVGFAVEWSTAGDERVCPLCEPLEGVVLKIEEARGLIPRHPQCRCALLPSGVVEDEDLVTEKKEIEEAIKESIMAESPKRSKRTYAEQKERTSWGGANVKVGKDRPKFLIESDEEE